MIKLKVKQIMKLVFFLINLKYKLGKHEQKLFFLAWILIPYIPLALLWTWLSPVGFWQSLVMFILCIVFYVVLLLVELAVVLMIK